MDVAKIKANGPWVLCRGVHPPKEDGLEKRGSLYIPNGTAEERTGFAKAEVLSVGKGYWTRSLKLKANLQKGKDRFVRPDFKVGDIILHKGWLKESQPVSQFDDDHFFLHMHDVEGVFEKEESAAEAA